MSMKMPSSIARTTQFASIEIGKYGESGIFVKDNGIGMTSDEINSI
jgi:DNA mismatch repair ATPase MutL